MENDGWYNIHVDWGGNDFEWYDPEWSATTTVGYYMNIKRSPLIRLIDLIIRILYKIKKRINN